MHNKYGEGYMKKISRTQGQIIDKKCKKIAIKQPFRFFYQTLSKLSKNSLLVTCIKNLSRIHEKPLTRTQGQIIDVKCEKSAILNSFSAIIELVWELVICNRHSKFGEDTWTIFPVIVSTIKCYSNAAELQ